MISVSVCLRVCLPTRISQKLHVQTLRNFITCGRIARFSSDDKENVMYTWPDKDYRAYAQWLTWVKFDVYDCFILMFVNVSYTDRKTTTTGISNCWSEFLYPCARASCPTKYKYKSVVLPLSLISWGNVWEQIWAYTCSWNSSSSQTDMCTAGVRLVHRKQVNKETRRRSKSAYIRLVNFFTASM